MIYLLTKAETLSRTCNHAQVTPFTALLVDHHGSFYSAHFDMWVNLSANIVIFSLTAGVVKWKFSVFVNYR